MKVLQPLLFDFIYGIFICVSFNVGQFEWAFTHIIQVFRKNS
jgi:hypothetical protein